MIVNELGKRYVVSIKTNGDKYWYFNDKLHREAGPAIELIGGGQAWYLNGNKVKCASQQDFEKQLKIVKTAEEKKYYDVKVECMLPATLTYRVLAKDAEEAYLLSRKMQPNSVHHRLSGKKELKAMVYDAGSSIIKFIKNLI